MAAAGFLVDQLFFLVFFIAFFILNIVQLLVERKAQYDQRQLNANLRIREWKTAARPKGSGGATGRKGAAANNDQKQRESGNASDETASKPSDDSADSGSHSITIKPKSSPRSPQLNRPPRVIKVGPMQWALHRVGVLVCLLEIVIHIDPYGVHNILTRDQTTFLTLNGSALCFIAGVVCFYYPIHLIGVFALNHRNKTREKVAISVSVFIILVSNFFPAMYALYSPKNYLRATMYLFYLIACAFICIVFNISMKRLEPQVLGLIEYHLSMTMSRRIAAFQHSSEQHPENHLLAAPPTVCSPTLSPLARDTKHEPSLLPGTASSATTLEMTPIQPISRDANASAPSVSLSHSTAFLLAPEAAQEQSDAPGPSTRPAIEMQNTAVGDAKVTLVTTYPTPATASASAPPPGTRKSSQDKPPAVRDYERMMKKLKRFQVFSTSLTVLVLIGLIVTVYSSLLDPNGGYSVVDPDRFSSAVPQMPMYYAHVVAVGICYWYAYVPMQVLWQKL